MRHSNQFREQKNPEPDQTFKKPGRTSKKNMDPIYPDFKLSALLPLEQDHGMSRARGLADPDGVNPDLDPYVKKMKSGFEYQENPDPNVQNNPDPT